jgi:hypothetical protein
MFNLLRRAFCAVRVDISGVWNRSFMQDEDVGRGIGERVCLMQTARTQDSG